MYVVGGGDTPTIYFNAQSTRTVLSGRRRSGATGWGGGRGRGTIILVLCWKLIYGKRTENRRKDWHGGQESKESKHRGRNSTHTHKSVHTINTSKNKEDKENKTSGHKTLTHQRTRKTWKTKLRI